MTLDEWATKLERDARLFEPRLRKAMAQAAEMVKKTAQENIGHLQPEKGPFNAWAPLAASTVYEKQRLGYDFNSDHNPLLRTGQLRWSIHEKVFTGYRRVGFIVGSTDPIAAYQEFGTSRIPARPFIQPALFQDLPVIGKMLNGVMQLTIGTRSVARA